MAGGDIPDYWQTALDEGVSAVNSAVESAGSNKSAFLFYTDAHWGYGSGMSPTLLKYLGKNTAINKTIFGGDFGNTYEYPDTGIFRIHDSKLACERERPWYCRQNS